MNYYGYYYAGPNPYIYPYDMYFDGNRQMPQAQSLDRRLTQLERKFERLENEITRLNRENNRQNNEFTRMNREIERINNEIIRLNRNDERNTRQHNRFNQRLRTIEGRLNIPNTASDDD